MKLFISTESDLSTLHLQPKNATETPAREVTRSERVDVPALRRESKDVLQQLDSNIRLLEDLNGRLGFMLGELRGLIRTSKRF
jgi:hypothetical protein